MFNAFPILMQRRLRMFFLLFQILSVYQMTPNPLSIVTKMHAFFLLWLLAPQRQIETRKVLHINHVCQYNTLRLPHLTNRRDGWLTLQCQVRLVWSWALPMSQVPPPPHTKAPTRGRGAALSDHKQKYTKTFCSKAVEGNRERWHLSFYCIFG